jgi:hypothetical protein
LFGSVGASSTLLSMGGNYRPGLVGFETATELHLRNILGIER